MKKIIIGFLTNGICNGIDKYLIALLETISQENVQIDFLTTKKEEYTQNILSQYHCNLLEIPRLVQPFQQYKALKKIYQEGNYDVAYFNISEAFNCIAAIVAKKTKIPKIIIHSHSSNADQNSSFKKALNDLFRNILYRYGDDFVACSEKAGYWLFPKKIVRSDRFHVHYNEVDFQKFQFNEAVRSKIRKEYHLDGKVVIGHVGNFIYSKNHQFLIKVFDELQKSHQPYHLVLIGRGKFMNRIQKMVSQRKIEDKVTFVGVVDNIHEWMQAMDIFVLPSYFEGLPIVGTEAQAANLVCFVSDTVTPEVKISEKLHFYSLKKGPKAWAKYICETMTQQENNRTQNAFIKERADQFNIELHNNDMKKLLLE